MPPIPRDISILLDALNIPIKHVLESQDSLRQQIEELKTARATQQEQIRGMNDEISELKKDLKEARQAILEAQKDSTRRIIYIQSSILFLVLSTIVGLLVKFFFHG